MHINVTFFIQIINLFITYKVLDIFLLRPVIASLQKKEQKQRKLQQTIDSQEQELLSLEKQKVKNLALFQETVKQQFPLIQKQNPKILPLKKDNIKPSINQVALQKKIETLLVKKVLDVY